MSGPKYFAPGTLVAVQVPASDINYSMLQKFNGKCCTVKAWHKCGISYMYTLRECRSKMGMPYWFSHDWLRRVSD